MRSFQLNPVNPDRGWVAVAVLFFPLVMSVPERFEVAGVGLLFLDREFLWRIGSDSEWDFDRFRGLDAAGDLMDADGLTLESSLPGNLALRVADLDEAPVGRGVFRRTNVDAQSVVAGRHFFRGHGDAAGAVSELQIRAAITMWQGGVVFVIG